MPAPFADLPRRPLPPAPPAWSAHGPGVAWLALALGSGELVWWPQLVAKYGLTFLWLLVPACLLQYPLTVAIGRYTLLTGEGVPRGLRRLNGGLARLAAALMLVVVLSLGALASSGGAALAALTQMPGDFTMRGRTLLWSYASVAVLIAALGLSSTVWRTVARVVTAVAMLAVVGLVWACAHSEVRSTLPTVVGALAGPPGPSERAWDVHDSAALLIAVVLVGLGGLRPLFYGYWIRGAGAGMARHGAGLTGILGRAPASGEAGGHLLDDAPETALAWRDWRRWLAADALIAVGGNLAATLLACVLAYALLYPRGIVPADYDVIALQKTFVDLGWGTSARAVYLVVTAALLSGAWLATADAASRMCAELLTAGAAGPPGARPSAAYWRVLATLTVVTCLAVWLEPPDLAVRVAAALGVAGAAVLPPTLLLLDGRRLAKAVPSWARPRVVERVLLAASAAVYALLAAAYAWAAWPWW